MIIDYSKELYTFLSQFAKTYEEQIVSFKQKEVIPSEYITYSAIAGSFAQPFIQSINLYSNSTSFQYL